MAIDYRPSRGEHYARMFVSAPVAVPCGAARRAMRRYRADRGPCAGAYCARAYRDDWVCDAPLQEEWPVIEECFWQSPELRVVGRVHPGAHPRARRRGVTETSARYAPPRPPYHERMTTTLLTFGRSAGVVVLVAARAL